MVSQPINRLGKILRENLVGNFCRKMLYEILAGKFCGKWRRGKSQFKKGSDWWKFSIWNKVIGSQPIRIQLGKILWEIFVGNFCGKILQEILAGKSCGKWRRGKSQFKKGSDWWKFSIWNRVMGSQPIRIQLGKILGENLAGKSCGKILQEIIVGKSCGKFLWEMLWEILWEIWWECYGTLPIPIPKLFLKVVFKICNSSRSTSFSLVNL